MHKSILTFQVAVHKQTNAVQHLSVSNRMAPNFLVSESFPWPSGILKWLVESLLMIWPIFLAFDTSFHEVMPQFCIFENLLSTIATPVFDVKVPALEALKPFTTRSFTNSGLAISI